LSHDINILDTDALKNPEGSGQLSPASAAKSPIVGQVWTGRFEQSAAFCFTVPRRPLF
jgi:hypothetical protein